LVEVARLGGQEVLFYRAVPPDVALIRATTADEAGNLSFEEETAFLDALPLAQAARNHGGMVIAQVRRLGAREALAPAARLGEGTFTVEQGAVGGIAGQGAEAGVAMNHEAQLHMAAQFDFYDGGGLDVAFLSFAELDRAGNANVTRFGGRLNGPGGFINIS